MKQYNMLHPECLWEMKAFVALMYTFEIFVAWLNIWVTGGFWGKRFQASLQKNIL